MSKPRAVIKVTHIISGLGSGGAERMLHNLLSFSEQVEVSCQGKDQIYYKYKTDYWRKGGGFPTPTGKLELYSTVLEEMGYAVSSEQEGKKVYSITDEGNDFLKKQQDVADGVRSQMKSKWSFKNVGRMVTVMREFHEIENLLGRGFQGLDADKAILHQIDPANAICSSQLIEFGKEIRATQIISVHRHWVAPLKVNLHIGGITRSILRSHSNPEHFRIRFPPRILEYPAFI